MIQKGIRSFWEQNSLENIQPNGTPTLHEGWDIRLFLRELYTPEEYGTVLDIGCGYGRLAKAFHPLAYKGFDVSEAAIAEARTRYPGYKFNVLDEERTYPMSTTKLLIYVLLHQVDEDIEYIIEQLCKSSERVIVAEICGREWRREGNPPVFNRNVEEYLHLFIDAGKQSSTLINKTYVPYNKNPKYNNKNTDLNIMVFE